MRDIINLENDMHAQRAFPERQKKVNEIIEKVLTNNTFEEIKAGFELIKKAYLYNAEETLLSVGTVALTKGVEKILKVAEEWKNKEDEGGEISRGVANLESLLK